ncbi:hypothetical protein [Actinoplanes subtropicus]|uniref:hypothetical protein n=1 Tax=Actinoplanes subtropicus TaxID=543632 RepID=UPI000AC0D524|nr:hypothetical protein [Actinoplanes subtropicus]
MASLASIVIISAAQSTSYTACAGCGKTRPLPRNQTKCRVCQSVPQRVTRGAARAA